MADYKTALQEGLKASRAAEANIREIEGAMDEFCRDLKLSLKDNVTIEREEGKDGKFMVCLQEKDTPLKKVLFSYKLDLAGYPVCIEYSDDRLFCDDKASIEATLLRMLRDPGIGMILKKFVKF